MQLPPRPRWIDPQILYRSVPDFCLVLSHIFTPFRSEFLLGSVPHFYPVPIRISVPFRPAFLLRSILHFCSVPPHALTPFRSAPSRPHFRLVHVSVAYTLRFVLTIIFALVSSVPLPVPPRFVLVLFSFRSQTRHHKQTSSKPQANHKQTTSKPQADTKIPATYNQHPLCSLCR